MKKYLFFLIIAITILLATACQKQASKLKSKPVMKVNVDIVDFLYKEQKIKITKGSTVTWKNFDEENHTVTANNEEFDSSDMTYEQEFTYTFKKSGSYLYICTLHPEMTGTVIVK